MDVKAESGERKAGSGELTAVPTMDELRMRWRAEAFGWINLWDAEIVHSIAAGDGWVLVIGERVIGSYEWVYWPSFRGDPMLAARHSDAGYCSIPACLRDGLISVEGLPTASHGCQPVETPTAHAGGSPSVTTSAEGVA